MTVILMLLFFKRVQQSMYSKEFNYSTKGKIVSKHLQGSILIINSAICPKTQELNSSDSQW